MEDSTMVFARHLSQSLAKIDLDGMLVYIQNLHGLLPGLKFDGINCKDQKIHTLITGLRKCRPAALFFVMDYLNANNCQAVSNSIGLDMTRRMLDLEEQKRNGTQSVVQSVSIDGSKTDHGDQMVNFKHDKARMIRIGGSGNGKAIEIFHPTNSSVSHVSRDLDKFIPVNSHKCHLVNKNEVLIVGLMVDADYSQHKKNSGLKETVYLNLNTFEVKPGPTIPALVCYAVSASLIGKLYICGGATAYAVNAATAACYKLIDNNRKWMAISSLKIARLNHTMSALNGHLYVIGGRNVKAEALKSVECYCPVTNQWIELKSPMNDARYWFASLVHRGKIWVTGGGNKDSETVSTTEVFDPITEVWSYGPRLNQKRSSHSMVEFCGKMYVIGGNLNTTTMEVFNDDTNKWELLYHKLEKPCWHGDFVVIE